jgi:putative spermidine/putrescine transport system substrate-binding protein
MRVFGAASATRITGYAAAAPRSLQLTYTNKRELETDVSTHRPLMSRGPSLGIGRRRFLKRGAQTFAAISVFPHVFVRRASAAGRVVLRTFGGQIDEAARTAVWDPFTKATGIEVVPVVMPLAKFRALSEAGTAEVDMGARTADSLVINLKRKGLLEPINYKMFQYTDPNQLIKRDPYWVPASSYSFALAYNTDAYPIGKHPKSWAQFWDAKTFPGPRTMPDISIVAGLFEFALLADGVPPDKLYPLDVDRAFRMLDRIRPSVKKFWETGAISEQLMATKEVVLASIADGRALFLMKNKAPIALERNQQQRMYDYHVILKGAPNQENAQKLIDFEQQPERQAELATLTSYGPNNKLAFKRIRPEIVKNMAGSPEYDGISFEGNPEWWADNLPRLNERWISWRVQG